MGHNDSKYKTLASIHYRQIQVLMVLANKFLEAFILPVFQFFGALVLIGFLYAAIMGGRVLSPFAKRYFCTC